MENGQKNIFNAFGTETKIFFVVYPPVNVTEFNNLPLGWKKKDIHSNEREKRKRIMVSIAQFREEKNHPLQIRAFKLFLDQFHKKTLDTKKYKKLDTPIFYVIGSVRNDEDQARLNELKLLTEELKISKYVKFKVNEPFDQLKKNLGKSMAGIHTMWCEHFGIGVVEMMAAGSITIAHNSGGPKKDLIIHGKTGFLAATEEQYAHALLKIFVEKNEQEIKEEKEEEDWKEKMAKKARKETKNFSDEKFCEQFLMYLQPYLE